MDNQPLDDQEQLLADVQRTQTAFWDALHALEAELDIDIDDSTVDFEGHTVKTLLEEYGADADDAEASA